MASEVMYPKGLRVLLVDDNIICLKVLESLLQACQYTVTSTDEAAVGLQMLRENSDNFDIVISDVRMPGMDGFTLLDHIRMELDIPVIMVSAYEDPQMVMEGVKKGAVDYLLKPARLLELKNIWQHVVRRNMQKQQKGNRVVVTNSTTHGPAHEDEDGDGDVNVIAEKGDNENEEDDKKEQEDDCLEDPLLKRKTKDRVVWCPILHNKFLKALDSLGLQKALPKKILEHMNVEGLTRANVASHLQKYRLHLKRRSTSHNTPLAQSGYHNIYGGSLLRSQSHSSFGNGGRPHQSAASLVRMLNAFPRSNLSQPLSNIHQRVPTFMEINPPPNFQNYTYNNNHNDPVVAPLESSMGIPNTQTFINPIPQQDQPYFNNGGSTQFQTPMLDPQAWQQNINGACNNNYNPVDVPAIGSSSPEFLDFSSVDFNDDIGPLIEQINEDSGLLEASNNVGEGLPIEQLSENSGRMETSFLDGFSFDDNFEFDGSELMAGLTNNDGGTLEDIVTGCPN